MMQIRGKAMGTRSELRDIEEPDKCDIIEAISNNKKQFMWRVGRQSEIIHIKKPKEPGPES